MFQLATEIIVKLTYRIELRVVNLKILEQNLHVSERNNTIFKSRALQLDRLN